MGTVGGALGVLWAKAGGAAEHPPVVGTPPQRMTPNVSLQIHLCSAVSPQSLEAGEQC